MLRMVRARFMQLVIVMLLLSVVIFVLMKLAPGDPVLALLNVDEVTVTKTQEEALREELGLNQPIYMQYWDWLGKVLRFDFGDSLFKGKPVLEELVGRLPATIELAIGGMLVMILISVPLGLLAARFPDRWPDHASRMFSLIGASVPAFWIGLLLIYSFAYKLDWLPTMGRGDWQHLVLPSVTLGFGMAAVHARLLRTGMLETLSMEYIRSARARGIPEWRIFVFYAMRGALIPVLTLFGMTFGSLIAGSVVVETIFSWPGLGSMAVEAIFNRDYPLVQGYLLLSGAFIIIVNLLIDIVYGLIDPRIRLSKGGCIS